MALGEGSASAGGVLVPPQYGNAGFLTGSLTTVRCPVCGTQMVEDASHDGSLVCPHCGHIIDAESDERFLIDFDIKSVTESQT